MDPHTFSEGDWRLFMQAWGTQLPSEKVCGSIGFIHLLTMFNPPLGGRKDDGQFRAPSQTDPPKGLFFSP